MLGSGILSRGSGSTDDITVYVTFSAHLVASELPTWWGKARFTVPSYYSRGYPCSRVPTDTYHYGTIKSTTTFLLNLFLLGVHLTFGEFFFFFSQRIFFLFAHPLFYYEPSFFLSQIHYP
jgi:hypothetical protein